MKTLKILLFVAIAVLAASCESNKDSQRYTLCDVLSQPKLIVRDSIEIVASDLFTSNGDGIYQYELRLDGQDYERLGGMFSVPFCLDDLNCSWEIGVFDKGDPLTAGCD
jgi:hypothetical protein